MANTDRLGHNQCNYEPDSINMSIRSFIDIFGGHNNILHF